MIKEFVIFGYGLLLGAALLVGISTIVPEWTKIYKQGQVDAINGKILFELKKNEDGTTEWVRK